jgi:cysteine-S-conjugate beta-lyase
VLKPTLSEQDLTSPRRSLSVALPKRSSKKTRVRAEFLANCQPVTQRIQYPIVDIKKAKGHLNPEGRGTGSYSRKGPVGQSSVGFDTLDDFAKADASGKSPHGGAEYAIVQSPEAEKVCEKFTKLHNGKGAIICVSGLSAITTTIETFRPKAILIPENVYFPAYRYLVERGDVEIITYPPNASRKEIDAIVKKAAKRFKPKDIMLYAEAPGSGTFEIPNLKAIVKAGKRHGIRTVMDNTWASHARFKPLNFGFDIAIQATTKYESGKSDTPSGVIIAKKKKDLEDLKRYQRISGTGAVLRQACLQLFKRVDTVESRLNKHDATAHKLMQWFEEQPFVANIRSPAYESSPDHSRFKQYFRKGNGLFTIEFKKNIPEKKVKAFINSLLLFRIAESWGGDASLVVPVHPPHRKKRSLPKGVMFRFHAGLENAGDLLKNLQQAARVFMSHRPSPRVKTAPTR